MTAPIPESLLAEIIGISADAIICVGRDQRVTFFNEGAEQIFGYTSGEVLGQPLDMLLPVSARAAHHRHIEEFISSPVHSRRMGERRQIAGRRKNGEEFPAEAAIAKLEYEDEVLSSVVLRDVTERKRAEARQRFLLETSALLAASLELDETLQALARLWIPVFADLAVVEMVHRGEFYHLRAARSADGTVEHSDIVTLAGMRLAVIDGIDGSRPRPVSGVAVDAALAAVTAPHRAAVEALSPRTAIVVSLHHRDGLLGRITLFARGAVPLCSDDLMLAEDLARRSAVALENARLHDQLRRAVRARDDTISVVSHDLRNPVNAVKMLAGAVLQAADRVGLPAEINEQVSVIQSAAHQMDTLIQDLLDMSRVEAGRFAVDMRSVPCASLLRDALRTLAPLAANKGVALVTEWQDPLPDVPVDPERIAQVISNIVGNAIKFTSPGGCIRVAASAEPAAVLVSVIDTGPGIPAEHLAHIFDRYWQSSRRNRGAGLGLPIAKAIVEAHHGRIWAESVPGEGATFRFTLPR